MGTAFDEFTCLVKRVAPATVRNKCGSIAQQQANTMPDAHHDGDEVELSEEDPSQSQYFGLLSLLGHHSYSLSAVFFL